MRKTRALAPAPPASELATEIVRLAATPELDTSKLQALIDMQERMLRAQAEAAFNDAFCQMQGELPIIAKTSQGDQGKWAFASLDAIVEQVRPILQKHGFSLSHEVSWPSDKVMQVTGILAHRLGHQRTSSFQSTADLSGSKNAIQGLGSANTYGRRYTTCDLLGIATRDEDGSTTSNPGPPAAPAEPDGFTDWAIDMQTVATEGTAALRAAWTKSRDDYRTHMLEHYGKKWEFVKRIAAQVSASAPAAP